MTKTEGNFVFSTKLDGLATRLPRLIAFRPSIVLVFFKNDFSILNFLEKLSALNGQNGTIAEPSSTNTKAGGLIFL